MSSPDISLSQLLQTTSLPVDVDVVRGLTKTESSSPSLDLPSGRRLRLYFTFRDPVLVGCTEAKPPSKHVTNLTIPLDTPNVMERLPNNPRLDDLTYETAEDVLNAEPRPDWIRVQESYDGGEENTTVNEDDELVDIRRYRNPDGEVFMLATRRSEWMGEVREEELRLRLGTSGHFTTRANPRKRYYAGEVAAKEWALPQRVRVHYRRRHPAEVPKPGIVVKLLRRDYQAVFVCSDRETGQLLLLPVRTLADIRVRVAGMPPANTFAAPLHTCLDLLMVPRIGPGTFDALFDAMIFPGGIPASAKPMRGFDYVAVLMPSATSAPSVTSSGKSGGGLRYQSLTVVGVPEEVVSVYSEETQSTKLEKIDPVSDENLLAIQSALVKQFVQVKKLLEWQEADEEASQGQKPEYMYPGLKTEDDDYEDMREADSDYAYADPDKLRVSRKYMKEKETIYESVSGAESEIAQEKEVRAKCRSTRTKLNLLRSENAKSQQALDDAHSLFLTKKMTHLPSVQLEPNDVRAKLEVLDNSGVVCLLRSVGLQMYEESFRNETVEGYLLPDCDSQFLKDLGMRAIHAHKLMAVIKGRLPPGKTWESLTRP